MKDRLVFAGISFSYRRRRVFEDLDWTAPDGKTVLLGPNGAGKTTLLALAADVLRAQGGTVRLGQLRAGKAKDRSGYRAAIGWMPQQIRAIPGFTAREQVAYAGWLKGLSRSDAWRLSLDALHRVGLVTLADRLTSEISGGELRRVGLGQLLVHDAAILLLDEPTAGLDPAQRATFREIVAALPGTVTVVVSTHQVDDLSDLFGTVVILDRGVIRHQSSVAAFLDLAPLDAPRRGEAAYAHVISRGP